MANATESDRLAISMKPSRSKGEGRSLTIKISIQSERFRLVDLLQEYGRYPSWETFLEEEIRIACDRYFADAESLLSKVLKTGSASVAQSK
jgi:hypothetical protein